MIVIGDSGFAFSTRPGMTRTHAPGMQGAEEAPNAIDQLGS
jgi:hypothetical protein